jgi:hypothetical protein
MMNQGTTQEGGTTMPVEQRNYSGYDAYESNPFEDYDEQLGYDADHNDSSQYCRHGSFIGSWWGPDYLCGYCESGEKPPTAEELEEIQRAKDKIRIDHFDRVVAILQDQGPWRSDYAAAIMEMADNDYWANLR